MAIDLEKITEEFKEYELDPGKIDTKSVYANLMMIKDTLDLSTPAAILQANSTIASLSQVLSFKAARCAYWETKFKDALYHKRIGIKYELLDAAKLATPPIKLTKEELEDKIEIHDEILKIKDSLLKAELGRKFWDRMLDTLSSVSHRVDSAGMQHGVVAKTRPVQG